MILGKSINLVEPSKEDWNDVKGIWEDESTMKDVGGIHILSQERYLRWFESINVENKDNNKFFLIRDKDNLECFGEVSFHRYDIKTKKAMFNIKVKKQFRNRGMAKEAVSLILDYYFTEWKGEIMEDSIWIENKNGLDVLKKLGFDEVKRDEKEILIEITKNKWITENKTQILLLGSFHFMEEKKLDLYSVKVQNELDVLVKNIAKFNPDKVAIEAPFKEQSSISYAYEKVNLDDFYELGKMKNTVIGELNIDGNSYPIKYNNEAVQIGFRLGKILKHEEIYAIDYFVNYKDENLLEETSQREEYDLYKIYKKNCDEFFQKDNQNFKNMGIVEKIKYHNDPKWSEDMFKLFFLTPNEIGAGDNYIGANKMLMWYERNIKIFAHLQKLSTDSRKIVCVYGAGHLPILKEFIEKSDDMEVVDVFEYI